MHAIQNDYFGGTVSVAGLVTGTDIIKQCKGNLQQQYSFAVPEVMLRDEKDRFLDDTTLPSSWGRPLAAEIEVYPNRWCRWVQSLPAGTEAKTQTQKAAFFFWWAVIPPVFAVQTA